jgi:membrane dipeptidase
MNRYGIIIDLAHTGARTSLDAIEASADPVVISHANPVALNPSFRNKTDELIKALAAKGGVLGLVSWNVLVERAPGKRPTISDYADHIEYAVNLVGIDHVGIGSDINDNFRALPVRSEFEEKYYFMLGAYEDIANAWPDGFAAVEDYPNLTRTLLERGFSDEDILKLWGGNFLRVAEKVWAKRRSYA